MKTNKTFWEAVDWAKEHGHDAYNQFPADVWAAAMHYVREMRNVKVVETESGWVEVDKYHDLDDQPKPNSSEVLDYIRKNF